MSAIICGLVGEMFFFTTFFFCFSAVVTTVVMLVSTIASFPVALFCAYARTHDVAEQALVKFDRIRRRTVSLT